MFVCRLPCSFRERGHGSACGRSEAPAPAGDGIAAPAMTGVWARQLVQRSDPRVMRHASAAASHFGHTNPSGQRRHSNSGGRLPRRERTARTRTGRSGSPRLHSGEPLRSEPYHDVVVGRAKRGPPPHDTTRGPRAKAARRIRACPRLARRVRSGREIPARASGVEPARPRPRRTARPCVDPFSFPTSCSPRGWPPARRLVPLPLQPGRRR